MGGQSKEKVKQEGTKEGQILISFQKGLFCELCLKGRVGQLGVRIRLMDFISERRLQLWCLPGFEHRGLSGSVACNPLVCEIPDQLHRFPLHCTQTGEGVEEEEM